MCSCCLFIGFLKIKLNNAFSCEIVQCKFAKKIFGGTNFMFYVAFISIKFVMKHSNANRRKQRTHGALAKKEM